MDTTSRRAFLRSSIIGASGALLSTGSPARVYPSTQDTPAVTKPPIRRKLGATGIELPVVSMGVMRSDSPGLVRAALAAGLVHLDTAHGYMRGRNEEMLGNVLKEYSRDAFVIATKVQGEDGEGKGAIAAWLRNVDISLRRLQLDTVDILYLHSASSRDDVLNPNMLEALQSAKDSGRTRCVGVSTHESEPEVLDAAVESGVIDVVLTSINFRQGHRDALQKSIERAGKAGIGVVAMKTMAGAFYDKARQRPINCVAALKWVLQNPYVTTAIPGITSYEMLEMNARVNQDLELTEEERASIAYGPPEGGLYCDSCGTCVEGCPHRLPIPGFMRAYMYTYGYRDLAMARELLGTLPQATTQCGSCSSCTAACVKGFDVAGRIADVKRVESIPEEFLA
jgi:predicted aldo/keto reductase-like oxidoreductase